MSSRLEFNSGTYTFSVDYDSGGQNILQDERVNAFLTAVLLLAQRLPLTEVRVEKINDLAGHVEYEFSYFAVDGSSFVQQVVYDDGMESVKIVMSDPWIAAAVIVPLEIRHAFEALSQYNISLAEVTWP